VLEPELLLPPKLGDALAANEIAPFQRAEEGLDVVLLRDRRYGPIPEHPPDHRRVEQERPLVFRQRVEPRCDERLDARR
jgi:hypothetical protein